VAGRAAWCACRSTPRTRFSRPAPSRSASARRCPGISARPLRLQLDLTKPAVETPAEREQRAAAERQRQAEHAIEEDPLVREMQKVFDATVDRDSIRPAD
jgi:hypothetical protein